MSDVGDSLNLFCLLAMYALPCPGICWIIFTLRIIILALVVMATPFLTRHG